MGEASKYYTPEIEEFHVGFEYEFYEGFDDNGDVYEKRVFHEHEEPYYYKDSDSVRVKHLDREDIESLGWELESCMKGECTFLHKTQSLITENMHVLSWDEREKNNIGIFDGNDKWGTNFLGTIKNKSELKRILKQLGI